MIFQHTHELVLEGKKSQTRRLCKPGEILEYLLSEPHADPVSPNAVFNPSNNGLDLGSVKWVIGRDYAVQPGRGKKAVGRIRLTGIRQEHVQDITEADAVAEGMIKGVSLYPYRCPQCHGYGTMPSSGCEVCNAAGGFNTAVEAYRELWQLIHTKSGTRWNDNPLVFVLEF